MPKPLQKPSRVQILSSMIDRLEPHPSDSKWAAAFIRSLKELRAEKGPNLYLSDKQYEKLEDLLRKQARRAYDSKIRLLTLGENDHFS